jgi:hypothetical protein
MINSVARTSYIHLGSAGEPELEPIDIFAPKVHKWGKDFYISAFRHIEEDTNLSGFTFYLTSHVQNSLPEYRTKIILVIVLDEYFAYRDYFNNIHCIFRCLGTRSVYLDGFLSNKLRVIAFFQSLSGNIMQDYKAFGA